MISGKSQMSMVLAIAVAAILFGQAEVSAQVNRPDTPPDPKKATKKETDPVFGTVNATPDMVVSVSGKSGESALFTGKTKSFRFYIQGKGGGPRPDATIYDVENLAKLDMGEVQFGGKPLSGAKAGKVVLEIDDLHCPGVKGLDISSYYDVIDQRGKDGVIPASFSLTIENGPTILLTDVMIFGSTDTSHSTMGAHLGKVKIVATTAYRLE